MLSDADKQRIEEEERYRAEVRARQGAKGKWLSSCFTAFALIAIAVVLLFVYGFYQWQARTGGVSMSQAKPALDIDAVAATKAPCGETELDARVALDLIASHDYGSAVRMRDNDRTFFMVDKGTRVRVKSRNESGSYSEVYLVNGEHSGRTCYVASGALR